MKAAIIVSILMVIAIILVGDTIVRIRKDRKR